LLNKFMIAAAIVAISAPAMATDFKVGAGIGVVQSHTSSNIGGGGAVFGGGAILGTGVIQSTQTASASGLSGAQFSVNKDGMTAVTENQSMLVTQQTLTQTNLGINGAAGGGVSYGSVNNVANAAGIGGLGFLKY